MTYPFDGATDSGIPGNNVVTFPFNSSFFQPRYLSTGKRVGVEPYPAEERANRVQGGVLQVKKGGTLTGLKVIFGNERFAAGSIVYLRSDRPTMSLWAKEVFELEGAKFILVPEDEILVVDTNPLMGSAGITGITVNPAVTITSVPTDPMEPK